MDGVRIAKLFSSACIFLLAANLCFRGFLYPRLHIAPGAPYGISDLIELLLGCSLILVLAASVGVAAFLGIKGPRANRFAALSLGSVVIFVALVAGPLHTVVARLASA